jgi:hypothetical protein
MRHHHYRPDLETLEDRAVPSATAADFVDGVWRWDSTVGWSHISNLQATQLKVDDQGNVIGTFSDGLWRWNATTGWSHPSNLIAQDLGVAGNGVIYGDFGASGTWRYDPSSGNWALLSSADPTSIAVSRSDSFFGVYNSPSVGVWNWTPQHSWSLLTQSLPDTIATDDRGEFIGVFNTQVSLAVQGIWLWSRDDGFQRLTTSVPQELAVSADGTIFADLGGSGIWRVGPHSTDFRQISIADPSAIAALPGGDLFAVINGQGFFYSSASQQWFPVTVNLSTATAIAVGSDTDLFVDEGAAGGLHHLTVQQGDVQISNQDPMHLAAQNGTVNL